MINTSSMVSQFSRYAFVIAAFSAAQAMAQNNIGTLDDRSDTGNYASTTISGTAWGRYTVPENSSTDSNDPRIERKLEPKIDTGNGDYTFQATYNVEAADNSTIAQILNYDPNSTDKYKPVIFVIARSNGTKWDITNQGTFLFSVNKNTSSSRPTFTLKIVTNGSSSKIYYNGSLKGTFTHARTGRDSEMRYGCYHHGNGTAKILVRNVSFNAP